MKVKYKMNNKKILWIQYFINKVLISPNQPSFFHLMWVRMEDNFLATYLEWKYWKIWDFIWDFHHLSPEANRVTFITLWIKFGAKYKGGRIHYCRRLARKSSLTVWGKLWQHIPITKEAMWWNQEDLLDFDGVQ